MMAVFAESCFVLMIGLRSRHRMPFSKAIRTRANTSEISCGKVVMTRFQSFYLAVQTLSAAQPMDPHPFWRGYSPS